MNENARYEGRICVEGEDIIKNHAVIMNKVGLVSSDNSFFGGCTCRQNAKILGPFYDEFSMETFEAVMEELKVSPGKVYLLDEVTVGMDPVFRREFFDMMRQLIKDERASVLLTSHILSEMEINTDYAGVLKEGRLIVFGESPLVVAGMNGKSDSRMEEQQDKGRVKIK